MKLYNRTPLPDKVIRDVLAKAARAVGVKHGHVLVEIGHGDKMRGCAEFLTWKMVCGRGTTRRRRVMCHGAVFITLPTRGHSWEWYSQWYGDGLDTATRFYKLACHEFAHVRDYHAVDDCALPWSRRGKGGRRPRWAERPEEQRAIAACEDAAALGRDENWAVNEIVEFAAEFETLLRGKDGSA